MTAPTPQRTDAENETITTIWRAIEMKGLYDEALKELREHVARECAALTAERDELRAQLDRADPGVHSCSETCQRPICVLRRERDSLLLDKARLNWIEGKRADIEHSIRHGGWMVTDENAVHDARPSLRESIDLARENEVADSMRQAPVD